jgi:hypothetical protein
MPSRIKAQHFIFACPSSSGEIIAKLQEVSCAKRREIIHDSLTAASLRQTFATETSSNLAIYAQHRRQIKLKPVQVNYAC